MKTNFEFLKQNYTEVYDSAEQAEKTVFTAPRTSAFYSRLAMESAVQWMFNNDSDLKLPYEQTLSALTHEPTFKDTLAPGLFNRIFYIRKLGNVAVHSTSKIKDLESLTSLRHLHAFLGWFYTTYTKNPLSDLVFDESVLQKGTDTDKTSQQLKELQEALNQKEQELFSTKKQFENSEEEIRKLRSQTHETKTKNKQRTEGVDYTEDETRKLIIDIMLREVGWDPNGHNVAEYEVSGMPNDQNTGYVDYVLWGDNGLPLAIVEAKKTQVDPKIGQRQAELYADCLEKEKGQRPVIFYSSGYKTWIWDDKFYPPREVQGFYTKDELELLVGRRTTRRDVFKAEVNKTIAGRYYQLEAIKAVGEAFQEGSRKALLVMATGTGKTRVSVATVEMLLKNNWVKNILFLADRTALVNQAKNAFNAQLPNISAVDLTKDKETSESRIVFSTYPTMMNMIDEVKSDGTKRFGVGHFDLIIIDEAHRSVYMKYGSIFQYFDSLLLGLTATPKDDLDKNTYQLFQLEDNVPTYAYELKQAIEDEFLVPPKAVAVPLKFPQEGITYDELSEEEKQEYELTFRDAETEEIPDSISSSAVNDWLFNKDTVDKVLQHLLQAGIKVQGGDMLGKTIIFAKNHKHAEFIKERFDANFPELKGKFLRVIDNYVKYAQSLIDEFSEGDKPPFIAASVDMLDTGIDVPEVVNLVFFKPVKSKVKFWQMIGRGTRLCPDLFGAGKPKDSFNIFDYCGNFEFFRVNPDGTDNKTYDSLSTKIFKKRLFLIRHLQDAEYQNKPETKRLYEEHIDSLHQEVSALDVNNFMVRPHREIVDKFKVRTNWNNLTLIDVNDLIEHVGSINMAVYDEDEDAKRFDLFILTLQLAIIEKHISVERLQSQLVTTASNLEKKANIPFINAKIDMLKAIQEDNFWQTADLVKIENIRKELRDLIKFLDKKVKGSDTFTNFTDTLHDAVVLDDFIDYDLSLKKYKRKVEAYLREHQENIVVKKIMNNVPITLNDLESIEDILVSTADIADKEELRKLYQGKVENLGLFIRKIVGLSRKTAKELFADYLDETIYNSNQIAFMNQLINHIVRNGLLNPEELYETPFIDYHFMGVEGLYTESELGKLFEKITAVNSSVQV